MGAGPCVYQLEFVDRHGSYDAFESAFIKETYSNRTLPPIYWQMWDYLDDIDELSEEMYYGGTPFYLDGSEPGLVTTYSIIPGKRDGDGNLMPCEIEMEGSGPCIDIPRPWEIALTARDWTFSFLNPNSARWMAPYGADLPVQCELLLNNFNNEIPIITPKGIEAPATSYNNRKPPSFHEPAPLPHESAEFTLKLSDEGGSGWWNNLKFFPNQYVLDDGSNIIHEGTLVGQSETTETFRLRDGTYYLRMLGHKDIESYDDMWSFGNKDGVIAFGGRYDTLTFTVSNREVTSSETGNIMANGDLVLNHPTNSLAQFEGLRTDFSATNEKVMSQISSSPLFKSLMLNAQSITLTESAYSHPYESTGVVISAALIGMAVMYGIMTMFKSSSYNPVMDVSQTSTPIPKGSVEIQLGNNKKKIHDCKL